MVFDPMTEEERKQFFRQNYGTHLPGYTGHCPTLKFRVGKRFGANTQEIMEELLQKQVLKTGPYRPNSSRDPALLFDKEKRTRRNYRNDRSLYKPPPFILGYTGYIPGFNKKYGLSFMRAVEEGGKEWRETQNKLRTRGDVMRAHVERTNPRNLASRVRNDNVNVEINHGHQQDPSFFGNQVSPESPPIVGYTGHIPGARSEVALSRRYAQAARKGLELLQHERESRCCRVKDSEAVQRVLDSVYIDDTGHTRA
ncbi:protein FAM166B isoform X1 [Diachasma alloeum]|uniref:protein FAM166B isoform X1 n=2 Tax=Diachasma alloeum TaxID=454923 RepID=UPI000738283F|nr:protein FAM166B isoform X1 [Diachasma alloeum]